MSETSSEVAAIATHKPSVYRRQLPFLVYDANTSLGSAEKDADTSVNESHDQTPQKTTPAKSTGYTSVLDDLVREGKIKDYTKVYGDPDNPHLVTSYRAICSVEQMDTLKHDGLEATFNPGLKDTADARNEIDIEENPSGFNKQLSISPVQLNIPKDTEAESPKKIASPMQFMSVGSGNRRSLIYTGKSSPRKSISPRKSPRKSIITPRKGKDGQTTDMNINNMGDETTDPAGTLEEENDDDILLNDELDYTSIIIPFSVHWVIWTSIHVTAIVFCCMTLLARLAFNPYPLCLFDLSWLYDAVLSSSSAAVSSSSSSSSLDDDTALCFSPFEYGWFLWCCDVFCNVCFLLNIYIQLHTAYVNNEQQLVIYKQYIQETYMHSTACLVDMITCVAILLSCFSISSALFSFFIAIGKFVQLWYLADYSRSIEVHLLLRSRRITPNILQLLKLAITLFGLTYILGTSWFIIARYEDFPDGNNWIPSEQLQQADGIFQFIFALYWGFQAMVGIGPGVEIPETKLETFYQLNVMVIGVTMYATLIGNLVTIMTQSDAQMEQFREKMEAVNSYCKNNGLSEDLTNRMRACFEYNFCRGRGNSEMNNIDLLLLDGLPLYLYDEIIISKNIGLIRDVPLFKQCQDGFLTLLTKKLKPQICLPGDCFIREGDWGDCMYFIIHGMVEVLAHNNQVAILGPGSFVGEISLLYSDKRNASIRALQYLDLLMLTRDDFETVAEHYEEDVTIMKQLALQRKKNSEIVKKVPLFKHCSSGFINNMVHHLTHVNAVNNQLVIQEGEEGHEMYFIESGTVVVLQNGVKLGFLGAGSFVGETSLFFDEVRNASIKAIGAVSLLVLTRDKFEHCTTNYPADMKLMRAIATERRSDNSIRQAAAALQDETKHHPKEEEEEEDAVVNHAHDDEKKTKKRSKWHIAKTVGKAQSFSRLLSRTLSRGSISAHSLRDSEAAVQEDSKKKLEISKSAKKLSFRALATRARAASAAQQQQAAVQQQQQTTTPVPASTKTRKLSILPTMKEQETLIETLSIPAAKTTIAAASLSEEL